MRSKRALFLQAPSKVDTRLAAEAAKIIMNACYEEENVDVALTCQGAARLVRKFASYSDAFILAAGLFEVPSIDGVLTAVRYVKV